MVAYSEEGAVDMAELEELDDVAARLVPPDLPAVAEDGEAGDGEAQEGLQLGRLPRCPPEKNVQLPSHLVACPPRLAKEVTGRFWPSWLRLSI